MPVTSTRSTYGSSPGSWSRISMILSSAVGETDRMFSSVMQPPLRGHGNGATDLRLRPSVRHHEDMARALLILPTGTYRAADFIEAAGALDAEGIVASQENMVFYYQLRDGYLLIDCSRPEESARPLLYLGARQ